MSAPGNAADQREAELSGIWIVVLGTLSRNFLSDRLIESMNPEWIDLFDERTGEILDGPADKARRKR